MGVTKLDFEFYRSKLKSRVFSTGYTGYVKKMTITCSSMMSHSFETSLEAST